MKNNYIKHLLGATLLGLSVSAVAEDIDLFLKQAPSNAASAPNMLLVMDNSANFSASADGGQVCRITPEGRIYTHPTQTAPDGEVQIPGAKVPAENSAANNTALSGTTGGIEQCALYAVIKSLDTSAGVKVNIGVMMFNSNGMLSVNPGNEDANAEKKVPAKLEASCVGKDGGCLVYPIVPLTKFHQDNLLVWIKNWTTSAGGKAGDTLSDSVKHNIKGPAAAANGGIMQESWAYFKGKTGLSGRNYRNVVPTSLCGKEYVVFLGNAYGVNSKPGDSTNDTGPKNALSGTNSNPGMNADPKAESDRLNPYTGPVAHTCPGSPNLLETAEGRGAYALNWARYMLDHKITTYSIGILGDKCNGEYAAHLTKMGERQVGGGKYFGTRSFAELRDALNEILAETQSVNSVFSAVSLPISVNTQGTYLNQVYIGMFRPDGKALPRWTGNLKQYKLGKVGNDIQLQDADSTDAINPNTGFITECARSFWTPNTVDNYWKDVDAAKGSCTKIPDSFYSNYPDGNIVEKGSQAFRLRAITPGNRTVRTCSSDFTKCGETATLTSFDTANDAITQALLDKTVGATNRNTLINWARGLNVADEEKKGTSVMRPSVHGDIVHSRPVAINYGTDTEPSVVVYYGANDGMLHAVNGNRGCVPNNEGKCLPDNAIGQIKTAGKTFNAGEELWSFMPPEFYSKIKRIYDNSPILSMGGDMSGGALPKPYGFDGPLTAIQESIGGSRKSMIYAAMRRGGRAIYAFDVTEPGAPKMAWKKGCGDNFPVSGTVADTDCSTGFTAIGQTWSSAKRIYASGYESGKAPMLIMGGGYDTCEDTDNGTVNHSCTAQSKGNRIYLLDASNGAALKEFETKRGVIGDVTIVTDGLGMAVYAYAADLGGNIYRISGETANSPIGETAPKNWTITRIASLGCNTAGTCSANRKFMYAPGVVYDNGLYILLIGSGDREKPLNTYTATYAVQNHFFMIKDDPSNDKWLSSENTNCSADIICKASLLEIGANDADPSQESVDGKKGWYLGLAAHEQVVTSTVTIFGTTTFSTHQPATAESQQGTCGSNLGTTLVYNIRYTNAASDNGTSTRYEEVAGNGLPPSPVAGHVTLDGNGGTVPFCIGCRGDSPLQSQYKPKPNTGTASPYKSRVYWYIQK